MVPLTKGLGFFISADSASLIKPGNEKSTTTSDLSIRSLTELFLREQKEEVLQVMDDLRSANVDFITIGQYSGVCSYLFFALTSAPPFSIRYSTVSVLPFWVSVSVSEGRVTPIYLPL